MTRLLAAALLVSIGSGCDTWAKHPIAAGVVTGGAMMTGGVALAADNHPLAGGTLIGLSVGTFLIAIPIGIVIDNFNAAHSR